MLIKSQAIVLHKVRYSDKDSIVYLYSADFGRIAYLMANQKKKGLLSPSLFQSLSLIEYEAEHKESRSLQRIKEARCLYVLNGILQQPVKNAISLFLAEVLYRILHESERDIELFDFLRQSIEILDLCEKGTANFHLVFLIKLTRLLGFYPNLEEGRPNDYFDLQAGRFCSSMPSHNAWLKPTDALAFTKLLRMDFHNLGVFRFERKERMDILRQMLDYYRIHLGEFPDIKSLEILHELFED